MEHYIHPQHDLILVKLDEDSDRTETGIYVGSSSRTASGTVLKKGPDVKACFGTGARIAFDKSALIEVEYAGTKFHLVRYSNVFGWVTATE